MTREQIIAQVLAKIDEVSPLAQEQEFSPAGTIDAIMNESVSNMLRNAPLHLLTPVKINTEGANFVHDTNADGTGRIALPSNFIRLYSFKMQAWSRPVEKTISVANPLYKLQHNPVTRGKSQKPVVALSYHNTGTGVDDPNIGIDPPVEGWNAIPPIYINDETIYHGSEAGQRHIPAGGELNQFLAFGSPSGVAAWSFMTDSIHGNRGGGFLHDLATEQAHGFMSSYDKAKLNTIQQGANYYEHPNQQGFKHIPQGGQVKDMLVWSAPGTAVWIDPATILELKIEQGNENEFFSWDKTWKEIQFGYLSDVSPYTITEANKYIRVNSDATGLEYASIDLSGYVTKTLDETITGLKTFTNNNGLLIKNPSKTVKALKLGVTSGTSEFVGEIRYDVIGANRVWLLPDASGIIALTSDITSLAKASGADINAGTDDAKYVTSLSIRNSNIFSAEKAGQFSTLTEKTSITANDAFVVEHASGGAKQLLKWSRIKAYNDNLYYGNVAGQFNATVEKTSLASNDRLIIEDSQDSYAKKSFKWSTVVKTLDSIYYWDTDSQFYSTTKKTTLEDNDIFIIEDAASIPTAYAKKSLKYSTLKTALDSLYGFWSAVTHGIKTNSNVGIGIDATSTEKLKVNGATYIDGTGLSSQYALYVMSQYGINVQTNGNGDSSIISYSSGSNTAITGISVGGNAAYLHSESSTSLNCSRESSNTDGLIEIISVNRSTSATAANGIGATIGFYIENSAGNRISPASIGARLSDATSGSEKGELLFYCNSAVRVKINKENDFEIESGSDIKFNSSDEGVILKSPNGTSYRVTIDDSGNLIRTAI